MGKMTISYNGWDRDYQERVDDYTSLFDRCMIKEYEGNTESLEKTFTEFTGRKYCVALASATDALHFSLLSHGIGVGDQVLVSGFSWISTASCISMVGAMPVFCDIDINSYHISIDSIKKMYTPAVKALVYTHLFGNMTDTTEIEQFCEENNIIFIEDAAQSLGSSLHNRKAGTIGHCSSYSFNANKVIGGIAGGGMFMTDDEDIAKIVSKLRRHGKGDDFEMLGRNSKMFVPNAEVIEFRFQDWEKWQRRRQEIAKIYDETFEDLPVCIQEIPEGLDHNYHKYTIRFANKDVRKRVKDGLKQIGLNASIHYEKPIYMNSMYAHNSIQHMRDSCDNCVDVSNTIMSLPIHAWLTDDEVDQIANCVYMLV